MKRLFICAERFFPRGDAGANRVLHIAKAMQEMGWDVIVLSIGKNDPNHLEIDTGIFQYEGIQYENIKFCTKGIIQKAERLLFNGAKTIELLKKHSLCKQDRVLVYSSTAGYVGSIIKYAQNKIGASVAVDVVEWHQPFQFRYGKYDLRYISFSKCFDKLFVEAKNVVVISELLKKHFEDQGCNVIKLPIYIAPKDSFTYTPEAGRLNLIYPGNPYRKDSLATMLGALNLLDDQEKDSVCLHLTGATREMLEKSVPGKEQLLDMTCVKIHGWMEYQELMDLYPKIDFALIARPDNIVTNANFPSKVPELMNKGIPVIINRIGDIEKYLSDGKDSLFIEDTSVESCAHMIKRVLSMSVADRKQMHQATFVTAGLKFDYHSSEIMLNNFFECLKE